MSVRMMRNYYIFLVTIQSCLILVTYSNSLVTTLPGYPGDLPFKLETGYVGIGENECIQLFYYFVESMKNPTEDPLLFHIAGGPGASILIPFFLEIGPLNINWENGIDNLTLSLNPNAWTQMANVIFVDIPVGTGFSYSETEEGWISSDTVLTTQAIEFIRKFLRDHSKFMKNPLYISGISYVGIIVPKVTLELYEGNKRGDQPTVNIQGYILNSPLTDKFIDFNSRLEYAHRMALVSDEIYQSAIDSCHGNYVDINHANSLCSNSLQSYQECIRYINFENILEPFCDDNDPMLDCVQRDDNKAITKWANTKVVQQALNIREGKIVKMDVINETLHYRQGKNDTLYYSYDIFSSFSYHKKLSGMNCRALIVSGDHDLNFPYVGVVQWITSLNLEVEVPWKPFYVDGQVGGYKTKYAQNNYSLTFATVKGAGHLVPHDKPKESLFMREHPKFLTNPLYISGMSYVGIIVPKVTLELYEGNKGEDQPTLNIQGYILNSPLTNKFVDFNSRFEYAHRMALISDDVYQLAKDSCHGKYVDINPNNSICSKSLQTYQESDDTKAINKWANTKVVQQALNIRQGKIVNLDVINETLHHYQGKNDTSCYSYDIFSSFSYHKKLSSMRCQALIVSGDHDFIFPYVGVEKWIASLNIGVEVAWKPFYVDGQVGGYVTKYAQNNYSLTFATVKGAGHLVPHYKPKESLVLTQGWFSSQTYSSDHT
ncbi:hypothetical protein QVD17_00391 [Tagetes erecta]|uniref:Peptidase S10, serine carboxypeptidase, Alpha/Beta hydrolase fold protein n=1 Tax=Tagetes erecta TaxID=13708 RepID=A0AAD8P765_TARER|nr:hypothetical protein QVD17_00391 [Tagetes erecta]